MEEARRARVGPQVHVTTNPRPPLGLSRRLAGRQQVQTCVPASGESQTSPGHTSPWRAPRSGGEGASNARSPVEGTRYGLGTSRLIDVVPFIRHNSPKR